MLKTYVKAVLDMKYNWSANGVKFNSALCALLYLKNEAEEETSKFASASSKIKGYGTVHEIQQEIDKLKSSEEEVTELKFHTYIGYEYVMERISD